MVLDARSLRLVNSSSFLSSDWIKNSVSQILHTVADLSLDADVGYLTEAVVVCPRTVSVQGISVDVGHRCEYQYDKINLVRKPAHSFHLVEFPDSDEINVSFPELLHFHGSDGFMDRAILWLRILNNAVPHHRIPKI